MAIATVGVIGLGTMGAGIVEVFAANGYQVNAMDVDGAAVTRGQGIVDASLARALSKGKVTEGRRSEVLAAIAWHEGLAAAAACDLIVEAAFEDPGVKEQIFTSLDTLAPDAILATNTSSLSVTAIAESISDPGRVLGVHFFNPAPVQKLVEVIRTRHTAQATLDVVQAVLQGLGKTAIVIDDQAGFVVNALLITYLGRAITLLEQGFATPEKLDEAMVAAGNPMGPLALADLVGNDVNLAIMQRMHAATGSEHHRAPAMLVRMVEEGRLGRKSGSGFYAYADGAEPATVAAEPQGRADELPLALLAPYFNDACRMVEVGYATEDDVNTGMALGCRMPAPFAEIDRFGAGAVLEALEQVHTETGYPAHEPCDYLRNKA